MGIVQRAAGLRDSIAGIFRRPNATRGGGTRQLPGAGLIERDRLAIERRPDGSTAVTYQGPSRLMGEATTPAPRRQRIGSGGTTIFSGKIRWEEFNSDLENEKGYGSYARQGVYDKMEKTSAPIKRALWLLKLPLLAADAEVAAVDDTPEEAEIADLVSFNLFEQIRWRQRMSEALGMFKSGFTCFEALADAVDVPRDRFPGLSTGKGGRPRAGETVPAILFTDFEPRPAKTVYQWVARKDKPTEVGELVQWATPTDGAIAQSNPRIPGDWLLRFTWEQEGGNFQGTSLLRPLYRPFIQADELETIDGIKHERQGCGIPVITLPQDAADGDIDKAQEFLLALAAHEKAFVVLPFGWGFEWATTSEGDGTGISDRLQQIYRQIAGGVLADFMELGAGGSPGSFALSETTADRHLDLITFGANTFLEVWNCGSDGWSPVKRVVDWNYGRRSKYPRVCFKNLRSKDDWAEILPLIRDFMQSPAKPFGRRTTYKMAAEIVRRLSLNPKEVLPPEEEFEEAPEPAPIVGVKPEDPPPEPGPEKSDDDVQAPAEEAAV